MQSTLAEKIEGYLHKIKTQVINSGSNRISTFNISRDGETVSLAIEGSKKEWGRTMDQNMHFKINPRGDGCLDVIDSTHHVSESYSISARKFRKKIRSLVFNFLEE